MASLTPEEIAQAEAIESQNSFNPLRDLSADDLASLAAEDKTFNIADEFQRRPELHADQQTVQKIADAHNKIKQRGFSLSDLPSVPEAAKTVGTTVVGLGKQLWNYANAFGTAAASAASDLVGAEGMSEAFRKETNERLAKNIAGTEEAMTGLAELGEKAINKGARALGIKKGLEELTPAERITDLFDAAGKSQTRGERLTGKGKFTKAVTGEEQNLDPEEVSTLAAGDPFSFYTFGRGAALVGQGVKAVTPVAIKQAVGAGAQAIEEGAAKALPFVAGKTLTGAAVTTQGALKTAEKTAPAAGGIAGGVAGSSHGPIGTLIGVERGWWAGRKAARGLRAAGQGVERIADLGRQISGSTPIKSAYAQGARDVLQALPGAAGEVAKGTALDIGLAAASAETPQDTEGAVGFGTALGVLGGARRVAGRAISGQLIAPREYGVNEVVPSSKQFSGLDTMHADAMQRATPGVRARLNAVRQFAEGAAPGTDVFLAGDSAAAERALIETGLPPETAKRWAAQEGLLATTRPGKDGTNRRIVIVRNVEAAPHEAFHAIQDVIGEAGNQQIDQLVREAYAAEWETEGAKYAQRLGGDAVNWRETVLDATGLGDLEAKEKIYTDIANRIETESGSKAAPKLVEEMAKAELGRRLDEALERNPNVDPNEISQRVWRDILTPEDITRASDKYIAREIAAENLDAIFKSQGPRLQEGKQLPQRLARIVGGLVSALGGDPLTGRTSEFGQVALKTPVVEAVRNLAREPRAAQEVVPTAVSTRTEPINLTQAAQELGPLVEPAAREKTLAEDKLLLQEVIADMRKVLRADELAEFKRTYRKTKPEIAEEPVVEAALAPEPPVAAEVTPEAVATEARALAADAPTEPYVGGTKSPRELLGQIAESIATQEGVKLNYLSAPGEPAAAITSNRTTRRAIIEAFRDMPQEARALWEKTFFPEKVTRTKEGKYQVQGWAPEVFASNAHKLAKFLAETPEAQSLSPYAVDANTKTFTPEAWQELYNDTQTFVQNQMRGATGSGEPLVVPRSVTEAGGFAPATRAGARALDQTRADFINALFNFKLPETPRMQRGRRPLNVIGQEVSAATLPGRVEPPVRPRGQFTGEEAVAQGIEGTAIAEVNPLRNQLEAAALAAKKPMPSFIEVVQKLNLENIKEIQGVPEQPQFRGNTLTLSAGFQPRDWRVTGQIRGEPAEVVVRADDIPAARKLAEKQGLRVTKVETANLAENAMFQPKSAVDLANQIEKFSAEEFREWATTVAGRGFTAEAWDVGRAAPNRAFVTSLKERSDKLAADLRPQIQKALQTGKFDDISAMASQVQFFREAYEAATGTGSAGEALLRIDPNYKPPFPIEG